MAKRKALKKEIAIPKKKKEVMEETEVSVSGEAINNEILQLLERRVFLIDLMESLRVNHFPIDSAISVTLEQTNVKIKELELEK